MDAIYVFNKIVNYNSQGNVIIDSLSGYAFPSHKKGDIIIGKFLVSIPAGVKVESPDIPYLCELKSGEIIKSSLRLKVPLLIDHPYFFDKSNRDNKEKVKVIFFHIGIIDHAKIGEDEAVVEIAEEAGKDYFICDYGFGIEYQELLEEIVNVESKEIFIYT
ncbi:MAG: hypothetical protein D3917_10360 [Candidatus Electrothrix sp. AX5]|nr:hypothetical protein [Candidatus Electrothrix sp. AX5]